MLDGSSGNNEFDLIKTLNSPITVQYKQIKQNANRQHKAPSKEIEWERLNLNSIPSHSDSKFIIHFISSNHPIYKYIRLELLFFKC